MAEDLYQQMYCCLACCSPFKPSKEALRSNSMSAKALYYIEGQVIAKKTEWNCTEDPVLLSRREASHIFHETNIKPVLEEFFYKSLRSKWLNNSTNFFGNNYNPRDEVINAAAPAQWPTVFRQNRQTQRFVMWAQPQPIPQIDRIHNVTQGCWQRNVNTVKWIPSLDYKPSVCRSCNEIMTQQSTTSHLLVRTRLVPEPLVPLREIQTYAVTMIANGIRIRSPMEPTPTLENMNGREFVFQACAAYAIHRCLPLGTFVTALTQSEQRKAHQLFSVFGFLLIEIMSLMVESTYGTNGGQTRLRKPRFRYRGVIELYISYFIFTLLKNDIPNGEPNGSNISACSLDFPTFHRYFFNSFIDAIVVAFPDYAHVMFITDVIFTQNWMRAGAVPFVPGMDMTDADQVLGYIAASIAEFYENLVRPYFSRHIAGLLPDPALAIPATQGQYLSQVTIYNMIIAVPDLVNLIHVCQRAVEGNTDTFINLAGVHAVLEPFDKMLMSAPQRATRLLESFMDSVTLREYTHIMKTLDVRDQTAETIYLECYALETPNDPRDQDELALLKRAPKCTAAKAAVRLIQCGAFKDEEDEALSA